jgi:hypothetical protein
LNTVQIIGVCLISAGALYFAGLFAYGKYKNRVVKPPVKSGFVDSDAPAPIGITAYMDLVEASSPTATPETRWTYAALGCTEADVLRREVDRLGGVPKT